MLILKITQFICLCKSQTLSMKFFGRQYNLKLLVAGGWHCLPPVFKTNSGRSKPLGTALNLKVISASFAKEINLTFKTAELLIPADASSILQYCNESMLLPPGTMNRPVWGCFEEGTAKHLVFKTLNGEIAAIFKHCPPLLKVRLHNLNHEHTLILIPRACQQGAHVSLEICTLHYFSCAQFECNSREASDAYIEGQRFREDRLTLAAWAFVRASSIFSSLARREALSLCRTDMSSCSLAAVPSMSSSFLSNASKDSVQLCCCLSNWVTKVCGYCSCACTADALSQAFAPWNVRLPTQAGLWLMTPRVDTKLIVPSRKRGRAWYSEYLPQPCNCWVKLHTWTFCHSAAERHAEVQG